MGAGGELSIPGGETARAKKGWGREELGMCEELTAGLSAEGEGK